METEPRIHVLSAATLREALDGVQEENDRELEDCAGDREGAEDTYRPGA